MEERGSAGPFFSDWAKPGAARQQGSTANRSPYSARAAVFDAEFTDESLGRSGRPFSLRRARCWVDGYNQRPTHDGGFVVRPGVPTCRRCG